MDIVRDARLEGGFSCLLWGVGTVSTSSKRAGSMGTWLRRASLRTLSGGITVSVLLLSPLSASATTYIGNPSNYIQLLSQLQPGDTLLLQAGTYNDTNTPGLPVFNLNGTPSSSITITGPDTGPIPVVLGTSGYNTVRIGNSSYVVIRNIEINGQNLGVDGVNNQGVSHHIMLEGLVLHGFSDDQGTVAISTNRATAWNWTIRKCTIQDAGTGMYLGNSDGNNPFIAGLIEFNLITNTIGYNIEIKHQNPRPNLPGIPTGDNVTIIRHNVFSKGASSSVGGLARPNLLVGHWPLSGTGVNDVYEIYGNFFYQNPSGESLFQGEGNVALYNNLFVANVGSGDAVVIQPQNDVPRMIRIFNNTVVASGFGIIVTGGSPAYQQKVVGNAVFASTPIQAADQQANITDSFSAAGNYLTNPFGALGQLDLYPKIGKLKGAPIDSTFIQTFLDWNRDFNGQQQDRTFRGAYAGEGQNPGWLPKLEIKPSTVSPPSAPTGLTVR